MLRTYADSDGLGLAALVRKGELTPIELVETAIATIEKLNPQLNAVIHKLYEMGRSVANEVDPSAPFAGVPFLLKELRTRWKGAPVTGSSHYLKDVRADSDTEVVKRIKAAGFLLVGKSNAPQNGWSLSTEPKLYGATFNPWRQGITPGGSSGGAAAAVASRIVPVAEATDAAGSIRVPASCCGFVGLKPTRGRLTASPAGDVWHGCAFAFCNTRTVRDTAAYLDAVAGCLFIAQGFHHIAPGVSVGGHESEQDRRDRTWRHRLWRRRQFGAERLVRRRRGHQSCGGGALRQGVWRSDRLFA